MIDNMGRIVAQGAGVLRYNARMKNLWAPWRMTYLQSNRESSAGAFEACIFCDALRNPDDRASLVVHRGKACFVILNLYPYNNGHLLVAPLRHAGELSALSADEHLECIEVLGQLTTLYRKVLNAEGFNIGLNLGRVAGAGLPGHLHWHLVPRWAGDTNFMPALAGIRVIPQSLEALWELLRDALESEDFGRH